MTATTAANHGQAPADHAEDRQHGADAATSPAAPPTCTIR